MSDLISRQDVLDAIDKYILGKPEGDNVEVRELLKLITKVYRMRSAQPEIIRCKDCLIHGVCRFEQGLGLDGYCSQAERKTDE